MYTNIQREKSYFELIGDSQNILSKSIKRNASNSQSKSIEKLSEINLDIEKLYKKYTEVKKERLMKEKSQQILVNRLKVLRNQENSSKKKRKFKKFGKI